MHAVVSSLTFITSRGPIVAHCWETTAGCDESVSLCDDFYADTQAAIIMFDVNSRITYRHVPLWYRDLTRVCGVIPVVLAGNKIDVQDRQVKPKQVVFHRRKNLQYYDISARSNTNIERSFVYLMRKVTGDAKLTLEGEIQLLPPELNLDMGRVELNLDMGRVELNLDMGRVAEYEAQLAEANLVLVPHDDHDDDL